MDVARLGPLERSILKALVGAEPQGLPLSIPQIWRLLPGYSTHLSNVAAALADGSPLSGFVSEARGQYVIRDRRDLLDGFARGRQRGELLWTRLRDSVESLCREPSVHGLALAGRMAWGLPPDPGAAIQLFVISAPRQRRQAIDAVQIVTSTLPDAVAVEVCESLSVDELTIAPGDLQRALELITVRPILAESAFLTLWEHNGWLGDAFPNFDGRSRLGGDVPDVLLGEVLEDRRGFLRRSLNRRARRFGGALRALGRRRGQRRGVGSYHPAPPPGSVATEASSSAQSSEHSGRRWAELSDWLLEDPPVAVEEVSEKEPTVLPAVEAVAPANGTSEVMEARAVEEVLGNPEPRYVAKTRQARQRRSVASSETGQRGRGKRKRKTKARKRRTSV